MKKDKLHTEHILECIDHLQDFIKRPNAEALYHEDWLVQAGILRTLQTLSESGQKLSKSVKKALPDIPWEAIAAMRNALVHGYLGELDRETVWKTIQEDLTKLKHSLKEYKKNNG